MKQCEQNTKHTLEEVPGIKIQGPAENGLLKELIASASDLLMMMHDDIIASGWGMTLHKKCAFERLCLCPHMRSNNPHQDDSELLLDLLKEGFCKFVIKHQAKVLRKKMEQAQVEIAAVEATAGPESKEASLLATCHASAVSMAASVSALKPAPATKFLSAGLSKPMSSKS